MFCNISLCFVELKQSSTQTVCGFFDWFNEEVENEEDNIMMKK